LGVVRALAGGRELGHHDLVHQRDVGLDAEDVLGELDLNRAHFTPPFDADFTNTSPPRGPGTAPLISSRPRSASTRWTVRFCVVTVSLPMRPAIFRPLNTRPGVAQPPIEPGE